LHNLYWIPKLHKHTLQTKKLFPKVLYKPLSILFTKYFDNFKTVVKEKLQMYCAMAYARNGVGEKMWILKNSKELLENL
jgi:hypothetical protein